MMMISLLRNFEWFGEAVLTNIGLGMPHRDPETKEIIYSRLGNEAIIINTQAAALAALGIMVPVMVALRPFRRRWSERLTEHL